MTIYAVQHVCLLANNISSVENAMQQNAGDPDWFSYLCICWFGAAGGLQVSGWAGWDPGGRLCRPVLPGLLFLGWDPLVTDHCTGCALPGASSWSWQHLHLCPGVPGAASGTKCWCTSLIIFDDVTLLVFYLRREMCEGLVKRERSRSGASSEM